MSQLLTKLKKFNPEKAEITLQVLFLDENTVSELIKSEGQTLKFSYTKSRYKETTRASSRRRWFQIISHVLKSSNIEITKETLNAFHESMKESFFDCQKFVVDGKEVVVVPSINAVSDEDVKNAIEAIISRYSQIGVDFSSLDR